MSDIISIDSRNPELVLVRELRDAKARYQDLLQEVDEALAQLGMAQEAHCAAHGRVAANRERSELTEGDVDAFFAAAAGLGHAVGAVNASLIQLNAANKQFLNVSDRAFDWLLNTLHTCHG